MPDLIASTVFTASSRVDTGTTTIVPYFAPSFYEVLPFCCTSEILKGSYFL